MSQLTLNTSAENEKIKHKEDLVVSADDLSKGRPTPSISPKQFATSLSAMNDGRRADAASNFSQLNLQNNTANRSNWTTVLSRPPASPKAEKDMLEKLDEVGASVSSWLKQL